MKNRSSRRREFTKYVLGTYIKKRKNLIIDGDILYFIDLQGSKARCKKLATICI